MSCPESECPEADGCPMCNTRRWSLKMYEAFQPLRDIIKVYPDLRVPIVKAVGDAMTNAFSGNFYGGMKP